MSLISDYIETKEHEVEKVANIRIYNDFPAETHEFRTNADVDYSRVLYSSSFRRLQGKMQLFAPKSEVLYRNRMTHSLEVAQIAKSIAKKFNLKDYLTVQTCSLAHDLGNPPFGHAGEIFLANAGKAKYEGNAQSFRILKTVEERHYFFHGLNLTIRTMLGIVKYFNLHQDNPKKFLYQSDYEAVDSWLKQYGIQPRTIDCEIMDIADEIAYAAHDLEDALKLKYFTIDDLIYEFKVSEKFKEVAGVLEDIVTIARAFGSNADAYKTSEEYSTLFRKELTSQLVRALVLDVDVTSQDEIGYRSLKDLSDGLKSLTFQAIKRQPDVIEYEQLGKHVLGRLFEMYSDEDYNKDLVLLPANYRFMTNKNRMILDYIGGMTDVYAIQQYEKYFGSLEKRGIYFAKTT